MITKWKLRNFKSFREETELEFAPLTIFAGANSTGKSSWVQSILLIRQTLDHRIGSRSVVLNGPLVRSGEFDDLRSFNSDEAAILIGWECTPLRGSSMPKPELDPDAGAGSDQPLPGWAMAHLSQRVEKVACEIEFASQPAGTGHDLSRLQPSLMSSRLDCITALAPGEVRAAEIRLTRSGDISGKVKRLSSAPGGGETPIPEELRRGLAYDVEMDEGSFEELRELLSTASAVGCSTFHFLPQQISLRIDRREEVANLLNEILSQQLRTYALPSRTIRLFADATIPRPVCELLSKELGPDLAESLLGRADASVESASRTQRKSLAGLTIGEFLNRVRSLHPRARVSLQRLLDNRSPALPEEVRRLALASEDRKPELRGLPLPQGLRAAVVYLQYLLTESIDYLGPLRDEPRALYPLPSSPEATEVGTRGESTASVLDVQRNRPTVYLPTKCFEGSEIDWQPAVRTLREAVDDWLRYLGVAESVQTQDEGKLGHTLQIRTIGSARPHDMTHAGVGASQVLPILVGCLLAQRDTTVLLEQPELHLHPKVQSRLADFFISMVLLGKQCVLETHSEYLINRIRYRVAAARSHPDVGKQIKIYFVEKKDDTSSCHEVLVNEYGAIQDWPAGFFDQSQEDAEKIVDAATTKRLSWRISKENVKRDD